MIAFSNCNFLPGETPGAPADFKRKAMIANQGRWKQRSTLAFFFKKSIPF
jgi:hypothetical protein